MTTGLAGCGRMGLPMGRALVRAGIDAIGFDIRPRDAFAGLPMEFDPDRFAAPLTILLTVLRGVEETDALLFDMQGILARAPALEYLVVCSTLPPDYILHLRQRVPAHIRLIDAPMSGGAIAAEEARLTFMLGGDPQDIDDLMLHFGAMGERFHLTGALGSGMTVKVLNNLVAAASTAATRTALDWGQARGIDHARLLAVLQDASGQTWFGNNFDLLEFARDGYDSDNTMGIIAKDVACAISAAPAGADIDLAEALIRAIRALHPLPAPARAFSG